MYHTLFLYALKLKIIRIAKKNKIVSRNYPSTSKSENAVTLK